VPPWRSSAAAHPLPADVCAGAYALR